MKSKIILFLLLTLLSHLSFAQGRKGDMFVYSKRLTPTIVTKAPNNTFQMLLTGPINNTASKSYIDKEKGRVCLNKVDYDAFVLVEITSSDVTLRLDDSGKPVVQLGVFVMVDYEASVLIKDINGTIISSRILSKKGQDNTCIQLSAAQSVAMKSNVQMLNDLLNTQKQSFYNETIKSSYVMLNRHACGGYQSDSLYIYSGKGKNYDYSKLDLAMEKVIEQAKLLNTKKVDTNLVNKTITEAIELWKIELQTVDFENPEARINRKLYRAFNYNIAVGYFLLKDFSKAYEYAGIARRDEKEEQSKIKVTDTFEQRIEDLQNLIEINF
ncbi:MAG: hypothetical protein U0U66_14815 [Cytophagaceae bacterium]